MDRDPLYKDYLLADYRFIVINKRTLTPLVWVFPDTRKAGTLCYGKKEQIELEDPCDLGLELHQYLSSRPKVPTGINETGGNNLCQWLNTI